MSNWEADREEVIRLLKSQARVNDLIMAWGEGAYLADAEQILRRYDNPDRDAEAALPFKGSAEVLVDLLGTDLLSNRAVRKALVMKASDRKRGSLLPLGARARIPESQAEVVAKRPWKPGQDWAKEFTSAFGFPSSFAGNKKPSEDDGQFFSVIAEGAGKKDLLKFQEEAVLLVRELTWGKASDNRAILSLPTGAGKTRTAVSALLDHLEDEPNFGSILWIAQTEEVCDQAVKEFKTAWAARSNGRSVSIGKLYSNHDFGRQIPNILVAGISKLSNLTPLRLKRIGAHVACIVIDEAHSAIAPSYKATLERMGVQFEAGKPSGVPILGLTATPGRGTEEETRRLVNRFSRNLLTPASLGDAPVTKLREQGVLATPDHTELEHSGAPLDVYAKPSWAQHWEQFKQIPPGMYKLIGEDPHRNRELVRVIKKRATHLNQGSVIVFACSAAHAMALSAILRRDGVRADYVTGETHPGRRAEMIDDLRDGNLQVIVNYGVLTIGFDAPKVETIVVARPTMSAVLYEQMIGRGMRGARFGGTEHCYLVDVRDNLRFEGQLAYQRYIDYWSGHRI